MPGTDGWAVLRTLGHRPGMPIIIITASDDAQDVVRGLGAGADDYVTKPFKNAELLARVDANLRRLDVLSAQAELQGLFTRVGLTRDWWDAALSRVIRLSGAEYGFVGRVEYGEETGEPILRSLAVTDIAWNDVTRQHYDAFAASGLQFTQLDTLYGVTLRTGEAVVSADPTTDPRAGGLPPGHPPLHAYMGVPIKDGDDLLGMIGLANRGGGFTPDLEMALQPLVSLMSQHLGRARVNAVASEAEQAVDRLEDEVSTLSRVSDGRLLFTEAIDTVMAGASVADALRAAEDALTTIVPGAGVQLFVFASEGAGELVPASASAAAGIAPSECVALLAGHRHVTRPGLELGGCAHASVEDTATICAPVATPDDSFGLLVVSIREMHQLGSGDTRAQLDVVAAGIDALADALGQVALRERLRSQALVDPLTRLANRRALSQAVERRLARTDHDARPAGIVLIDLDNFRDANEHLGHLGGDALLVAVGEALRQVVREDDVVARLGGDEFAVLVPAADDAALADTADRLRAAVDGVGGTAPRITCSVGAALMGWGTDVTWDAAYRAADMALYASKQSGKNLVTMAAMLGVPDQP
jgi:diguanylate cyclase (GGDEF)-like protein